MPTDVMGIEQEYILGAKQDLSHDQRTNLAALLIKNVAKSVPLIKSTEPSVNGSAFMLCNGAKIYVDAGNYPEVASAETCNPLDALINMRACEKLLLSAIGTSASTVGMPPNRISLLRAVTDYSGHFSGFHVNVLLRKISVPDLAQLLPQFLVTRYYSCAGGWGPTGFVMSHKHRAIKCVASQDTRENRAICNLKNEPLSKSFRRAHITHGDACMSDVSLFLSLGTTALVLRMLDEEISVGPSMRLRDPIEALSKLDCDLSWKTPLQLACGAEASALQIQEHYLAAAEAFTKRCGEPWMREVVKYWRRTLEQLRSSPVELERSLDPFIKRKFFRRILAKQGVSLEEFGRWCQVVWNFREHFAGGESPRPLCPRIPPRTAAFGPFRILAGTHESESFFVGPCSPYVSCLERRLGARSLVSRDR